MLIIFVVLGFEFSVSWVLGKHSITELGPQPYLTQFWMVNSEQNKKPW